MTVGVDDLKDALEEEGIRADLIVLGGDDSGSAPHSGQDDTTIDEFAGVFKLSKSRVLKTVTFVESSSASSSSSSNKKEPNQEASGSAFIMPLLVVLRGSDRVNLPALEERLGRKLRLAKASEVREITGCKIGRVSPFGVAGALVVIDEGIGDGDVILPAGSQSAHCVYLKIGFKDLFRLVSRFSPEVLPLGFRVSETAPKQ